ncbi:MAG: lysine transporter LysE [Peptococcaceae bacterium BICA1-8]|nr:MAG: lysine transporter LysE [Peptococcaceae bacterium BICA1-8]
MFMEIWLKGFFIGLSIAAPVGPIGVLCIRRTLSSGRLSGFVTGLGAALTDFIYAFIGGFGLTVISSFLVEKQDIFRFIGGLFIIYLGYKIFISQPAGDNISLVEKNLLGVFASSFIVAITNPIALIYYIAVFAGLGVVVLENNYYSASLLVAGVFMGSTLWWFLLSQVVGLIKNRVTSRGLQMVNRISGTAIAGFGIFAIWSTLY